MFYFPFEGERGKREEGGGKNREWGGGIFFLFSETNDSVKSVKSRCFSLKRTSRKSLADVGLALR